MVSDDGGLERLLKAFANRRRLAIVRHLKKQKEASVGDIAETIRLSLKATSKHLGILTAANVLDREQRGLQMFYRIADDVPALARALISNL
jgi:DNA-binding transcriptional ArsR family regulator